MGNGARSENYDKSCDEVGTKTSGMSRRAFLSGAAMLGATTALTLTSCQPGIDDTEEGNSTKDEQEGASGAQKETSIKNDAEQMEFDVVVVGAGTSGTCAALAAAKQGAKTVIVEKTGVAGGLSTYSGIVTGLGTSLQKEAGYDINPDEIFTLFNQFFNGTSNPALVRHILDNTALTIDWLIENGLGFTAVPPGMRFQANVPLIKQVIGHLMTGPNDSGADEPGAETYHFAGLHRTFMNVYGGEIMLNTRAFELVYDGAGSVTGVACEREDGSQVILNTKAVILTCGSWSGDTEYYRENVANNAWYNQMALSEDSGDGVSMGEKIGAQKWMITPIWHQNYFSNLDGSENYDFFCRELNIVRRMPCLLWVDTEGRRFANEEAVGDWVYWANTCLSQGGSYYLIIDQATVDDFEQNGTPIPNVSAPIETNVPRSGNEEISDVVGEKSGPITDLQAIIDEFVDNGSVLKVDTIDEIEGQAPFDIDVLKATIEEYNGMVELKEDRVFLKDPSCLIYPLQAGPYYVFRITLNAEGGSSGGLRVNKDLRVLFEDTGLPFSNLFAAGLNASGFFGLGGYADFAGMTMGFSTTSGRLAGQSAAQIALS